MSLDAGQKLTELYACFIGLRRRPHNNPDVVGRPEVIRH